MEINEPDSSDLLMEPILYMELNESMEERHAKATLRKECVCRMHCVAAGG